MDGGSFADLLFAHVFVKMILRDRLSLLGIPLVGFSGRPVMAFGQIDLAVTFSDDFASRTEIATFDVVQMPYQYNAILGRATLNAFDAIAHHNYPCMKISAPVGIITIRGDQDLARQTELETIAPARHVHAVEADTSTHEDIPSAKWAPKAKPEGQLRKVPLREAS